MNVRLAACEPCRRAKLACGHEKPTCARCQDRQQAGSCVYRNQPFKRRKLQRDRPLARASTERSTSSASPQPRYYPNPGFLGSSSHSAIFNQVTSFDLRTSDSGLHNALPSPIASPCRHVPKNKVVVESALRTLKQLGRTDLSHLVSLIHLWLGQGVNLPLAEPFVAPVVGAIAKSAKATLPSDAINQSEDWVSQHASLLESTDRPICLRGDTNVNDFFSQLLDHGLRWDVLGIFFTAASRATIDTTSFPPLYTGEAQRWDLIKSLTYIGDCCLETCLAADRLDDLQIVLQYENCVVHSQVHGDQSYHSWRRMGDLSSSLFALGYHERTDGNASNIPLYVAELRRAIFARIYAADKSLAIFLGRPPRIVKTYCNFQLPANIPGLWDAGSETSNSSHSAASSHDGDHDNVGPPEPINYTADTRYSALFASLKEEILELYRNRSHEHHAERTNAILLRIEKQWEDMPTHLKLDVSLKHCHLGPFERDFLVGTRLDYLHILLLLGLVSSRKITEPDQSLLTTAGEMLSLVVEMIILRQRLVAQFGLPAAGVISLALLNSAISSGIQPIARSKMVQDLSVLVAEIRTGVLIQAGEPNFALFTQATRTIQSLLDSLMVWRSPPGPLYPQPDASAEFLEDWNTGIDFDPWEFEQDFWAGLAGHPTLLQEK
ncbi:zn-c6 fungal-type dna-binding domain [Diplodia corticola]|uniref:Zn-c6 fungal-type dna-binding domain n=1 Tax=Diplodia corticola TaxID=236234 RepID=A0A1J9RI50_9PEZI|nr:zn-c6 fungal-type dna-binding domain [Diplodia corticola]OJD40320.1 zn-c6 fungal-type dna-binding domain [Diplodia corticola]